jgi:hypothetical protein
MPLASSSSLRRVEPRIRPEPAADERAAILAALATLLAEDGAPAAYRSGWREAGIRENVEEEAEAQGATGRPRSSPGATRA